ncbi:hypothetical protein D9758_008959 [Tetrapyrgos nigripes]|uniref:Retrotransposon gag domain-containing protein n=1 Tax=Tetrapyrgos nigripes TaxID=182062 RepID=A0A8H5GK49_9AGAR|nr:hypothetical protein D9758_008959 [Tetrapyrgos nigripes]
MTILPSSHLDLFVLELVSRPVKDNYTALISIAISKTGMKDSLTVQAILVQTLISGPFPNWEDNNTRIDCIVLPTSSAFLRQHFCYLPLPSPISHTPITPSSSIPSDINMSEQAQQPHFDMHRAEQIHQAATIHGLLQEQVTTFLQRINQQQPQPQAHTISQSSDKSSMAKPEPFKGTGLEKRTKDDPGEAGIWAVPYIEEAMAYNRTERTTNPFNGTWSAFVEAFKARFGSLDEQADARDVIEGLVQGKQTVVKYIQVFRYLGQRTGYSDEDL